MAKYSRPARETVPGDYLDPEAKLPRLPMPYRMIDNVLRDLIEEALELARDDPPREEPLLPLQSSFVLEVPDIVSVQASLDGLMVFVGTKAGKLLCINSLRGEPVGDPIDLEDSIRCMALSADGRFLAVAVGGADDEEDAEPKPSTVKLMLVQPDKPFLKTIHSTELSAEAVALYFSFDSCVFAAYLKTHQLECFRTKITIPFPTEPEGDMNSPAILMKQTSLPPGDGGEPPEEEEETPQITVTEPVRVLLTAVPQVLPQTNARTLVMLGKSPRARQVGELEGKHCVHVNMVTLGSHFVEKYLLREGALMQTEGDDAPQPESKATTQLRLPHAATAVAIDASTALLFTGMRNGACVIWNNVFGTQEIALKRHKAAVRCARTCLRHKASKQDKRARQARETSEGGSHGGSHVRPHPSPSQQDDALEKADTRNRMLAWSKRESLSGLAHVSTSLLY